jgi:hypothetical protein
LLQDFLVRNGPNENVSAALMFFQKREPRFVDLDRDYCPVIAGGEVIATPVDYPAGISTEEYAESHKRASGQRLWVEDVRNPSSLHLVLKMIWI